MVEPGNPDRMPSPGQLAPTRRMTKETRTQRLPARLPFKTDGPTTGTHHEYQHCWPLWQPNQTANFPALAITRVSGLTTNPGAKAFAPHLLKTHECRANNALALRRAGAPAQARPTTATCYVLSCLKYHSAWPQSRSCSMRQSKGRGCRW